MTQNIDNNALQTAAALSSSANQGPAACPAWEKASDTASAFQSAFNSAVQSMQAKMQAKMQSKMHKPPVEVCHLSLGQALSPAHLYQVKPRSITIPAYQRNYQWRAPNCAQLVDSIIEIAQANLKHPKVFTALTGHKYDQIKLDADLQTHEMLNWLIEVKTTNEGQTAIEVVDGQQRLTTLLLMMRALLMTLCRLYPQASAPDASLRPDHEEFFAAQVIADLGRIVNPWFDRDECNGFDGEECYGFDGDEGNEFAEGAELIHRTLLKVRKTLSTGGKRRSQCCFRMPLMMP